MKPRHYVLIGFLFVFILAVIGIGRWLRPNNLRTEIANARAAGIPLTAEEFVRVEPPQDQNALPIYLALGKALDERKLNEASIAGPVSDKSGTIPREKTPALKALLQSRPDVARLVHAAVGKPHVFVRHSWTADEMFSDLPPMRASAKWIRWESTLLARQGRYGEAVKHQALGFRVAQQAAEDPTLISYLVALACERQTTKGFESILSDAGPNAAVARAVREQISAYRPKYDLTRCLKGEVILGLTSLHQIRSIQDLKAMSGEASADVKPSNSPPAGPLRWFLMDPAEAIYLHWMTAYIQASRGPTVERIAAMAKIQAEFDKSPKGRPTFIFAQVAIPVFGNVGIKEVDAAANRAAVTAMANVMEYRANHGNWPATLAETGRPVPIDPGTGKPVGYRLEGAGFVISTQADTTGLDATSARKKRLAAEIRYPPKREMRK